MSPETRTERALDAITIGVRHRQDLPGDPGAIHHQGRCGLRRHRLGREVRVEENPDKILTWRWEYIGVVMRKGGNEAARINTVIECRGEFYSEKKCANLANDVFATLQVKER